jgi:NAD(P)-dependent dehydrogenase (short-subunit alcohol dehydrogenase family)
MSKEKVALVTGVSSGIGRAIAGLLSRHGFRVFGTARRGSNQPVTTITVSGRRGGQVRQSPAKIRSFKSLRQGPSKTVSAGSCLTIQRTLHRYA